ncbi:MAG: FAD-dependent oxidoreductase, partial [Thermoplasmata archaeon]|nr:FAD-dependent oxidoreductase [Thermoplasmata archaeon]
MTRVDVAVVGAGAVGLAVARALALQGSRVSIVERHAGPGLEQSTHNSQVVHSGLFVRPGSLRAEMCVRGNRMLYDLAPKLGVPVEASGTLVVASAARDLDRLALYREWGGLNGVPGVKTLVPDDVPSIEPRIKRVEGALVAPTGGRVDARAFVTALDAELVRLGVERHYGFGVTKASYADRAWRLSNDAGDVLSSTGVVNAAGVASAAVAALLDAPEYRLYPCLG